MTLSKVMPMEMEVVFHATASFGMSHVILKTITRTRTLKGGGFGLTHTLPPLLIYLLHINCNYEVSSIFTHVHGILHVL